MQTRGTVRKSLLAFAEGAGLALTPFHNAHLVELADDLHWLGVVGSEIKFRAAARLAKLVGPNQVVLSMRREGRGGRVSDCHASEKRQHRQTSRCARPTHLIFTNSAQLTTKPATRNRDARPRV